MFSPPAISPNLRHIQAYLTIFQFFESLTSSQAQADGSSREVLALKAQVSDLQEQVPGVTSYPSYRGLGEHEEKL
jgi:hypothetical protein